VLITPGANIAVYYAAFVVANAGDEILVPDPGFPTYLAAIDMCGATAVPYPLDKSDGFGISVKEIRKRITEKTKMIIVTSPNNPTGSIADESQLREVFELAVENNLIVFSDEIYSRMIYQERDFFSMSSLDSCKERVILSNGFSKAFAMTGWRLGTVVAPEEIAEKMMLVLQTTSSCVSPFIQKAGLEAITGDQSDTKAMMSEYRRRRDSVVESLNSIEGVACPVPRGSFYAFPDISAVGLSSQEFADKLLEEEGVALLPGTDFGANGEGHVRISFATSQENLNEGLSRIKRFALRVGN
jgi:aspartate/methionine/tyrosine aminotransferase